MDGFQPAREQDSWATLRGFKYQIDLSILRWLALQPAEHLELERGEDIDRVGQAVTGEEAGLVRNLEQIKVRDRRLTLRSSESLESLANCFGHFQLNSTLDLRFCFTTNATVTKEKLNPFPGKKPGIQLWEEVRKGELPRDELEAAVTSLRQFLSTAAKPAKVKNESWQSFATFMGEADESEVINFIQRFEWSCGAQEPLDLSEEVLRQVRLVGGAIDDAQVTDCYERLFLYLVRLLTQPGAKRLTKLLLTEQFSAPTLSASDHALVERLTSDIAELDQRVEQISTVVGGLKVEVQALVREHGRRSSAIELIGHVSIEPPPLVEHLSRRTATVDDLRRHAPQNGWLALCDGADTGKTHLANLTAGRFDRQIWIRFHHDAAIAQAMLILHASIRSAAGDRSTPSTEISYPSLLRRLGEGTVLVLDDLPSMAGDDVLTTALSELAIASKTAEVSIISTSRFRLPVKLATVLGTQRLLEIAAPKLSDVEANEVFVAHGAGESDLSSQNLRFINGLAGGHPLLIALTARYLAERKWKFTDEELDGLIRGDHTQAIADEVVTRVCQTLDADQREFLYRLALSVVAVTEDVAVELGTVDPPVPRPRECLARLIGAWVQRENPHKLVVSPLVRGFAQGNLSLTTMQNCHLALGEGITKEAMDPWDAQIAIMHFSQGADFDAAGSLYLEFLMELRRQPRAPEYRSLTTLWSDRPLPADMNLGVRILIRAMQFWILPTFGCPDEFILNDLDSLMELATAKEAAVAYQVASLATLFLSERDYPRALRYYSRSVELLRDSVIATDALVIPRGKKPVELLWTPITNVTSAQHVDQWMAAFDALTSDEQQIVVGSKDAVLGSVVLADRLVLVESEKATNDRNWDAVLAALHKLQRWANDRDFEHLYACALKSEVNTYGEYLSKPEECEGKVQAFIDDPARSEEAKSLVAGMYGKMLAGAKKFSAASPWLERAIKHPPIVKGYERMLTLMAAAHCHSDDPTRRIDLTERAAEIARSSKSISKIEKVKVLGELAIALVGAERTRESGLRAFKPWSEAAEYMLVGGKRDDVWKDMFAVFGHAHSFFVQLATTGKIPTVASDGSPYAEPFSGMFYRSHPDRVTLFHPEAVPGVMWFQSLYARSAGNGEMAEEWLRRAANEIEGRPLTNVTALIRQEMIPDLLDTGQFADAIDAGIRGTEGSVALREYYAAVENRPALPQGTPLEELVSKLTEEGRRLADRFSIIVAVVPVFLHICRIAVTNRQVALEHLRQVEMLCREQAKYATDPRYWNGSAQIFEAVGRDVKPQELRDLAESFDSSKYQELRILGYLALSLADCPESALGAQLASIEVLYSWYPPDGATHQRLLLPYIEDYWTNAFQRQRFHFRTPALVEGPLTAAKGTDPTVRVRAILRAVRPGFRVAGLSDQDACLNKAD